MGVRNSGMSYRFNIYMCGVVKDMARVIETGSSPSRKKNAIVLTCWRCHIVGI